jgi:uncharacterized protein (DUF427 family)
MPVKPEPGQESVWDYPRPPRLEPEPRPVRVVFDGEVIVQSSSALRILEISHPPSIYVPLVDVVPGVLRANPRQSVCEWKGAASYWDIHVGNRAATAAAWSYPRPRPGYEALVEHVSFYPALVDACYLGDEQVTPQAGGFYGGWITSDVVGPFKGEPGTRGL